MSSKFPGCLLLLVLLIFAPTLYATTAPQALALKAVSENSAEAAPAIAELRAQGPAGLNALFRTYAREIDEQVANPLIAATPEWQRLSAALDAVGQQKDSYLSGLYWYTDFAKARAAARAAGKPILSLQLLGKLNEEYSCANSRFFRTILYSNAEVSPTLRENFILYWESERPAPRVTIDFGDGRKLERTLTGNSIHYILDSDGRPLDALPGLYGPKAFLRGLAEARTAFDEVAARKRGELRSPAITYHRARLNAVNTSWFADIEKTGGKVPEGFTVTRDMAGTPQAIQVASLAYVKMVTEAGILRSMTASRGALESMTKPLTWSRIAFLHLPDAELDARSLGLIRRQTQKALSTDGSGKNADKTFAALVQQLRENIALDTVRNEYLLHTKIYSWFLTGEDGGDVSRLNKKVYAELFLTPASDPWLGLFSPEVYTALQGGGISR